jgi:hypothetical protein
VTKGKNYWASAMADMNTRTWEEVLKPGERLGGPTPFGSSFWSDFKMCPYYFDFTHNKRWRLVEYNENLEVGGLAHEAIGRYYQTALDTLENENTISGVLNHPGGLDDEACLNAAFGLLDRAEAVTPVIAAVARRVVQARLALYGPGTAGDDRKDTFGVEVYLGIDDPFPLTTRLDRWCWSDRAKGVVIHEFKTAREKTGRLLSSYRMDFQFLIQQYLWRKTQNKKKYPLKGYVVDLVTKTQQPDVLVQAVPVDDKLLRDFEKEMRWTHMMWRQCHALNYWPRNRSYRCRFCDLYDHCASGGRSTAGWRKKKKGEY